MITGGSDNSCPTCPFGLVPCSTHTHTHADAPSPTSTYPSLTISCSLLPLFSEVRAVCLLGGPCSDSRVGLRPPLPSNLNLRRYQPPRRQLRACLLKGTLPLEIMETLWQIQRLYLSRRRPLDRQGDSLWESTRFKCISWPLIIRTEVSPRVWSSLLDHKVPFPDEHMNDFLIFLLEQTGSIRAEKNTSPLLEMRSAEQDGRLHPLCSSPSGHNPGPEASWTRQGGPAPRTLDGQSRRCSSINQTCFFGKFHLLVSFVQLILSPHFITLTDLELKDAFF